jgi:hypothetical protein
MLLGSEKGNSKREIDNSTFCVSTAVATISLSYVNSIPQSVVSF